MKLERCDKCGLFTTEGYGDDWMDIHFSGRESTTTVIQNLSYCPVCAARLKEVISQFNKSTGHETREHKTG